MPLVVQHHRRRSEQVSHSTALVCDRFRFVVAVKRGALVLLAEARRRHDRGEERGPGSLHEESDCGPLREAHDAGEGPEAPQVGNVFSR